MVIEDNPDVLFNLLVTLEANGYEVETSTNGKEAAKLLIEKDEDSLPNLIISDIMMPEMDGYEFYQFLKNNQTLKDIPLIFLSALATPDDIRFAKILGVTDYLTKPFDDKDLLGLIEKKLSSD
jgi:CheY-like chemotaxis protein